MMDGSDPYEVLGLSKEASEEEIKEAYRERAKKYHPDVCDREDAEELFQEARDAYRTLLSEDSTHGDSAVDSSKNRRHTDASPKEPHVSKGSGRSKSDSGTRQEQERSLGEKVRSLDSLLSLHRMTDREGERWAVVSDRERSRWFVNGSGTRQGVEFWFGTEMEAIDAYETYLSKTPTVGERGSRGMDEKRGRADRKPMRGKDVKIRPPLSVAGGFVDSFWSWVQSVRGYVSGALDTPMRLVRVVFISPVLIPIKMVSVLPWKRLLLSGLLGLVLNFVVFGHPYYPLVDIVYISWITRTTLLWWTGEGIITVFVFVLPLSLVFLISSLSRLKQ
jgi:hypothetical protein